MKENNQKKKNVLQAFRDIIRCFTEKEENQSCGCGCGSVNQPEVEYQSCGCGSVSQPEVEYQSCGCGSVDQLNGSPDNRPGISFGDNDLITLAGLKTGETVLEIDSEGGTNCFEAARQVGPAGKVIGLDPAPEMVELAQNNTKKLGFANVEIKQGEMGNIPLADQSVHVIIANCTLSPTPDKDAAFAEVYRVLKPGGRINLSDTIRRGNFPGSIPNDRKMGAANVIRVMTEQEYLDQIRSAGFEKVEILTQTAIQAQEPGHQLFIISVRAYKPA